MLVISSIHPFVSDTIYCELVRRYCCCELLDKREFFVSWRFSRWNCKTVLLRYYFAVLIYCWRLLCFKTSYVPINWMSVFSWFIVDKECFVSIILVILEIANAYQFVTNWLNLFFCIRERFFMTISVFIKTCLVNIGFYHLQVWDLSSSLVLNWTLITRMFA